MMATSPCCPANGRLNVSTPGKPLGPGSFEVNPCPTVPEPFPSSSTLILRITCARAELLNSEASSRAPNSQGFFNVALLSDDWTQGFSMLSFVESLRTLGLSITYPVVHCKP